MNNSRSEHEELREKLGHIRDKRKISDRLLNEIAMSNMDGVLNGTLNWINDEATNLESQIKAIEKFCANSISTELMVEFGKQIKDTRKEIDEKVTGVLNKNPDDAIMQNYPQYISEIFSRIQILIPLLSNLYRMRAQLDSACSTIIPETEDINQSANET